MTDRDPRLKRKRQPEANDGITVSDDKFEDFRSSLEDLQRRWSEEDARDKISNRVTVRLAQVYREADPVARDMFDRILADRVRSQEPGKWFDASALIREFGVCSALPAVREALEHWRAELGRYGDFSRAGEYGLRRSQALSGVHVLEPLVQELEERCEEAGHT